MTGGRELNKFDLGDGDFSILGLEMGKKRKIFESGKCRTFVYVTANVGTEGASENFLFWDVFEKVSVTQSVLHRFG